jgi:hypothetical protein
VLKSNAAVALLRAILRDNCSSDLVALKHLGEAAQLRMDPLDYCAHQFGLGNELVWQRAAYWAGYTGAAELPSHPALPQGEVDSLDRLGEVRSLRRQVLGKDLTFVAPTFPQVLSLAQSRSPQLLDHIRFAPPEAIERGIARAASRQLMDYARQNITRLWPEASAAVSLPKSVRIGLMLGLMAMILVVMTAGAILRPLLVPLVAVLLLAPGLLRLFAAIPIKPLPPPPRLPDTELPTYTILIPLRDEAQMVPMLQRAMLALDYPPHKLDIKFVVESRSPETMVAVEYLLADPRFRMVVVPEGRPHTKPKALDFALPLARGEYLVVYDAEDAPEPGQLRLAAERFAADPGVACLQAELMLENANETVLTALFAGEYAGLFGRLLPALVRLGVPVPLGGTSNHFRTSVLRAIGGWDAFNVTEDADLGVRLARRGYRAETFASRTYEEAPLTILAWMNQRTRWMKGWMRLVNGALALARTIT